MFERQQSGSVVCPSCGRLVGVKDQTCSNCGRPYPGMFGFTGALRKLGNDFGFLHVVTWGCGLLYLACLAIDASNVSTELSLGFLSPTGRATFVFGSSGGIPIFGEGRWWTVLSASWLHGGLLHIAFNLMWIRNLAPLTAEAYGPGRLIIIYTVSGAVGFALTSTVYLVIAWLRLAFVPGVLSGAGLTVGASASLFGLLGALVYYGRRGGSSHVNRQVLGWAVMLFLFGFLGIFRVDNWAHAGGFLGGYVMGMLLDPLKPERPDHLLIGLLCLLASLLAVVWSFIHGLPWAREWGLL